jgi:hypothetical protein
MGRGPLIESRYYPLRTMDSCGVVDRVTGGIKQPIYHPSQRAWVATIRLAWLYDQSWRSLPLRVRYRVIVRSCWWGPHRMSEGEARTYDHVHDQVQKPTPRRPRSTARAGVEGERGKQTHGGTD